MAEVKGNLNKKEWHVVPSQSSMRMENPIRKIVDNLIPPNIPGKELISVSIGDPTVYSNFTTDPFIVDTFTKALQSNKYNGYTPSVGRPDARRAVAEQLSTPNHKLTESDIILTLGCSGALEMAIAALCDTGDNILLPSPGFSLYRTLCDYKSIQVRYYNLLPDQNWSIDLTHLASLIDSRTKAILVTNPSNPCGSIFSRSHMSDILSVASTHKIPLICDEVYAHMSFSESAPFYSFAQISTDVPLLICGGTAKRFLVPGWRLGWLAIHDRNQSLSEVRKAAVNLSQLLLGPNSLVQAILADVLKNTPKEFFESTNNQLKENAEILYKGLKGLKGVEAMMPDGAMYMMVKIKSEEMRDVKDDVEFASKLLSEEAVSVLPGRVFQAPGFIRLTLLPSKQKLGVLVERVGDFCRRHAKEDQKEVKRVGGRC